MSWDIPAVSSDSVEVVTQSLLLDIVGYVDLSSMCVECEWRTRVPRARDAQAQQWREPVPSDDKICGDPDSIVPNTLTPLVRGASGGTWLSAEAKSSSTASLPLMLRHGIQQA